MDTATDASAPQWKMPAEKWLACNTETVEEVRARGRPVQIRLVIGPTLSQPLLVTAWWAADPGDESFGASASAPSRPRDNACVVVACHKVPGFVSATDLGVHFSMVLEDLLRTFPLFEGVQLASAVICRCAETATTIAQVVDEWWSVRRVLTEGDSVEMPAPAPDPAPIRFVLRDTPAERQSVVQELARAIATSSRTVKVLEGVGQDLYGPTATDEFCWSPATRSCRSFSRGEFLETAVGHLQLHWPFTPGYHFGPTMTLGVIASFVITLAVAARRCGDE